METRKPGVRVLLRILIVLIILFLASALATDEIVKGNIDQKTAAFTQLYGGFTHVRLNETSLDDQQASIAVDREGYAHVAFVSDVLSPGDSVIFYATNLPGSWISAPLTFDAFVYFAPSIAVDANNNIHIIAAKNYTASNSEIVYIYGDSSDGTWSTTRLTNNAVDDFSASLAIDSSGNCYVAYMQGTGSSDYQIIYATNQTGPWVHTPLTSFPEASWEPSIIIDSAWHAHVAYARQGALYHMTNATGSWVEDRVFPAAPASVNLNAPSIGVDPGGHLHIAAYVWNVPSGGSGFDHTLYYSTNATGSWVTTQRTKTKNNSIIIPMEPSLVVDNTGGVHILYQDAGNKQIYLDSQDGSAWRSRQLTTSAYTYGLADVDRALAIDPTGHGHIAYTAQVLSGTNIHYARSDESIGPRWESSIVGPSTYPGYDWDLDIGIGSGNVPHISYYNAIAKRLQYGKLVDNIWQTEIIDQSADMGRYNAMAIELWSKFPTFIYYDATDGDVEHFRRSDNFTTTVDSTGDRGKYVSASIGTSGVKTSYYNATAGNLVYAAYGPPNWTWNVDTVDSAGDVGKFTSIVQDAAGYPHISYYDATNSQVKYATHNGTNWIIEPVGSALYFGFDFDTSIAVSSYGPVYIAYYDSAEMSLKLATRTGGSWMTETVDALGDVGQYNDIAVYGNGVMHIAYLDQTNGDLKYAHNESGTWHIEVIDGVGWTGFYPAIALDEMGWAHFAYYDMEEGNVKYARRTPFSLYLPLTTNVQ